MQEIPSTFTANYTKFLTVYKRSYAASKQMRLLLLKNKRTSKKETQANPFFCFFRGSSDFLLLLFLKHQQRFLLKKRLKESHITSSQRVVIINKIGISLNLKKWFFRLLHSIEVKNFYCMQSYMAYYLNLL